jgi:AcrR family transcriptional regulator
MLMQRALRPEQKEIRRKAIQAGAAQLFSQVRYQDLRMADLAKELGLGKGTLYLYFPTKEALFLAVLQAEMGIWFHGAAARLEATSPGAEPTKVAEGLVRELLDRPLLPGLQALLHGVLEQNVPKEETRAFAQFLQDGVALVGSRLEQVIPLAPGKGAEFLLRFYGLVIGTQLMSSRPMTVREALDDPGLDVFTFTFEEVFRGAVVDLLHGMLAAGAMSFA